ncbi:hypothetical protein EDD11_003137 [Mortierella claussenii]|nr:hypothetical protein EDD11_003137 [Mortierella claussenii]
MTTQAGSDDYRAWVFTLASAMACVFGAGLIFIDTIVKKLLRRDVRMLHNHKFLAGSLGLGSGVMIFSSFYNLLPEAKIQLSSDLSIFASHADTALMLFFFGGVGTMGLIHWIMHRVDSGASSPGIENGTIEQFMQQESGSEHGNGAASSSLLPQRLHHRSNTASATKPTANTNGGVLSSGSTSTAHPHRVCQYGCVQEESDEDDDGDSYSDSEYVDDEVTSLLNNAFLQIGKTPNSQMDDTPSHLQKYRSKGDQRDERKSRASQGQYDDDHEESIEVVIGNQKDKILRRAVTDQASSDLDMDMDDDDHGSPRDLLRNREGSWSSVSTRSQKPFAPVNKRKKSTAVSKSKSKGHERSNNCPHHGSRGNGAAVGADKDNSHSRQGMNGLSNYGAVATKPSSVSPRADHATHMRRTSFPRLKASGTIYSKHDSLDHAVADDREHADLTEIGIQTALTIAVHKFPEGLITFLSTTADPCLGLSVFMAIAVHNLIEGYLIAFPLYIGLHSRAKAFALAAALGGLSQPLGAALGWFILRKVASMGWQVSATGAIYALVAGMMSSIAVNGMWPQAVKCVGRNKTKVVQYCFFGGIAVMGLCQAAMGTKCDF